MDSEKQPDSIREAQKRALLQNPILQPDDSFGSYRVLKCLAAGLLAHYYQMQHVRDQHTVTVGIFHPRASGKDEFIKRLESLKNVVSGLEDKAIPKIEDCATIEGRICLFMDPVEGQTLSQYFEEHGHPGQSGIGIAASTQLIAQLLGALGCAHAQGIDHRDLDSDLIYIQENGSLRILGMGIKAAMGIEIFESIVSASVSPLETEKERHHLSSFDVMSPEYRGGVQEDSRVDIYAVGVIGYWLLTGHKPVAAKYKKPTEFLDGLLPSWDAFFENLLARNRESRFQSCRTALIGLKNTEIGGSTEGAGHIQKQIDRIPVPEGILERGALASRIYRLILIGLVGLSLTAVAASFLTRVFLNGPDNSTNDIGSVADTSDAEEEIERPPAFVDIELRTEPGATISVVDAAGSRQTLGETDEFGLLVLPEVLPPGEYDFLIEKEGYITQSVSKQSLKADESTTIEVALNERFLEASVLSQPDGAIVRLDGVVAGRTPLDLKELKPGRTYEFEAEKEGYRPVVRDVETDSAQDLRIDFGELVPLSGAVRLEVSPKGDTAELSDSLRRDLQVRVGQQALPFQTDALEPLPVGPTTLRLEHPLYFSEPVAIDIEDGAVHRVALDLLPRPGEVTLNIPEGIEHNLLVNQQPARFNEAGWVEVPAGRVIELELRMKNYLTLRRQINLDPTDTFVWEVEPVPIPGPKEAQAWQVPYLGIDFAWVPPGAFTMGSPLREHARLPEEGPQTDVRFTRGFWVGVHEVTQRQFRAVEQGNPAQFKESERPVESISWAGAKKFCQSLNRIEREAGRLPEGYVYRLPTEAEWEYAARAGTTTPFFWGSKADASLGQFNGLYPIDRADGLRSPEGDYGTKKVGQYAPNAFGLYDVHGNVREWTMDRFNSRLPGGDLVDPAPREGGSRIAIRGGGWKDTASRVRSASREQISPDVTSDAVGFRVVLAPEK
ncbi:MAG: SUMF1/EgtB/PvdO family nonheme iron enzyme [Verrucomicrobia bacterium]|jgi:formylglycine-generating enzyme required for sulfatase activity/serine/threonine protein kinase|nr:SUMF1/EgtB/PvdO family nonheme iron enzyme [Verrucomicrobiota bacterium]